MAENSKIEWTDHIDPIATGRVLGAYKTAARRTGCTVEEWMRRRSVGEKWCFDCRAWKAANRFSTDLSRAGGLTSRCKKCTSLASTASRYGMTRQELSGMIAASAGTCAVCYKQRVLVVDHRHLCGTVRGLLCDTCNRGLGMFSDDPATLRRAADYLEKTRG